MCHAQLPKIHFHAVVSLLLDGAIRIHKSVLCLSFFFNTTLVANSLQYVQQSKVKKRN